jgi:glutamate dehydrogenase (NAD(P)+)
VDEVLEVIPYTAALGLRHPQEGVVRGHLKPDDARFADIIRMLDEGVKAPLTDGNGVPGMSLTVADAATGYGVAASVRHLYQRLGAGVDGAGVLLEGFGNVGAACALYLARAGARVVGITDAEKALIAPEGLSVAEVEDLIRRRVDKLLPGDDPRVRRGTEADAFWRTPAEVFVCAALSGSITEHTLDALGSAGVRVIACGANQPFREAKIGSVRVARAADRRFAVLPDILANCGMARTFSYLLEPGAQPCCAPIFEGVEHTIGGTLDEVIGRADGERGLLGATLGLALDRIGY